MYGESPAFERIEGSAGGLSPRVRGIHLPGAGDAGRGRSIPACTGNPGGAIVVAVEPRVYPRVYGESRYRGGGGDRERGLSPRVRGIQSIRIDAAGSSGSIPACTGNPGVGPPGTRYKKVYPRVYGESERGEAKRRMSAGLSPRVRGIRHSERLGSWH